MSLKIIKYRLQRAEQTYQSAKALAELGNWNDCVNRIYYSCFYAVSALLLKDGFSSSKHTGVRSFFNKHYVKTGLITKTSAKFYNDLFEDRHEADYTDFVNFAASDVMPLLEQIDSFLEEIKQAIANPTN